MFSSRISGIRVEVTVHIEMVTNGRRHYNKLDLLQIKGLKNTLGGPFGIRSCALDKFFYWCHFYISTFAAEIHGRNECATFI